MFQYNYLISNFGLNKNYFKYFLNLILLLIVFSPSCKKTDTTVKKDRYYIKYEVNSTSVYSGGKLIVDVKDKDSIQTFIINTKNQWETNIGPVEEGFDATLGVVKSGSTDLSLKLYVQISVSVNNEPFVLKKLDGSDTPRSSVNINYKVGN